MRFISVTTSLSKSSPNNLVLFAQKLSLANRPHNQSIDAKADTD